MNILRKIWEFFGGKREQIPAASQPYPFFSVCDGEVIPARDLYAANSICREYQIRHTRVSENGEIRSPHCCFYDIFGKKYYARPQLSVAAAMARENAWKKRRGIVWGRHYD